MDLNEHLKKIRALNTDDQKAASRENGKKGGRPKGSKTKPKTEEKKCE